MENKTNIRSFAAVFFIAALLSVLIFQLLYHHNNKYKYEGRQPINGILSIDGTDMEKTPLRFLIRDWEFYENQLLTPSDFADGVAGAYKQYVSIGEYSSMSTHNNSSAPYGTGTYRLNLVLPDQEAAYALELPEIFSAYELYIGDKLFLKMGNIHDYSPEIQERVVIFNASALTPVTICVSDYSGMYSGMVYPPAFGTPYAVNIVRGIRIFACCCVFILTALMFLLSLYVAAVGRHKTTAIFTILCLAAAGYTCYPLLHIYFSMYGNISYISERFCAYLVYCLIIILQNRICGIGKKISRISSVTGIAVCAVAFLSGILMPVCGMPVRTAFSTISEIYKWCTALYLIFTSIYAIAKKLYYTHALLFGITVFAMSLLFDRIYSLYEPICGGWFPEIGCCVMIITLSYEHWREISAAYHTRIAFSEERRQMERQIAIHKENYVHLTEKIDEARKLRHDLRQHFRVMSSFLKNNQYDNLNEYLNNYFENADISAPIVFCNNITLDALFNYYSGIAQKNGIEFNISLAAQNDIPISDTDLSILFGNLIENAIEACEHQKFGSRKISLRGKADDEQIIFEMKNTFTGEIKKRGFVFYSSKHSGLGIGLESVKEIVSKYGGVIDISDNNNIFTVSLAISLNI